MFVEAQPSPEEEAQARRASERKARREAELLRVNSASGVMPAAGVVSGKAVGSSVEHAVVSGVPVARPSTPRSRAAFREAELKRIQGELSQGSI